MAALTFEEFVPTKSQPLTFDEFKPDFNARMDIDLQERRQKGKEIIGRFKENLPKGDLAGNIVSTGLQLAGNVGAGSVLDLAGNLIGSGARTIAEQTPDSIKQPIAEGAASIANSQFGRAVGEGAKAIGQGYSYAKENAPAMVGTLEAGMNLAGVTPLVKGVNAVAKAVPLGEASGVSINNAAFGIPEYTANRATGLVARGSEALNKSIKNLSDEAAPFYKAVDESGGALNANGSQLVSQEILGKLGSADELLPGQTLTRLQQMQKDMAQGITVTKLDKWRRRFSDIADDTRKSVVDGGGLTEEGRNAVMVIKGIDSAFSKLDPVHFSKGGAEVIDTLNQARSASARAATFGRIARIAKKTDGDPARIKTALKRIVDEGRFDGLRPNEIELLKTASKRSLMESFERGLGTFGFDFGQRKNVALPGLISGGAGTAAAFGGSAPLAIPAVVGGTAMRQASKLAARGKLERTLKAIESRPLYEPPVRPTPQAPMQALPAPSIYVNPQGQAVMGAAGMTPTKEAAEAAFIKGKMLTLPDGSQISIEELKKMKPSDARALLNKGN